MSGPLSRPSDELSTAESCDFPGCGRPIRRKHFCTGHDGQRIRGEELRPLRPDIHSGPLAIKRFWARVDKSAGPSECWPWTRMLNASGYGSVHWYGRDIGAHRVAFQLANGAIPEGLYVLHTCRLNRRCCNPSHLYLGTHADNMADMARDGTSSMILHPELRPKGTKHHAASFSDDQIRAIRHRGESGESATEIAGTLGRLPQTIGKILLGRRWGHVE